VGAAVGVLNWWLTMVVTMTRKLDEHVVVVGG